jgi:hypothetical protein
LVHVSGGPELPTLAERFIGLLRLPYPIGCIVIVGLALVASITQLGLVFAGTASFQLNAIVGSMLLVYALYAPRFMREKVLQTERAISGLLPNGEKEYHMLFGRISAYRPQLILFILFWVLTFFSFTSDPFRFLIDNISYSTVLSLGVSSTLWTYYSASRGIHKMGAVSMNLRPYFADPLLGLRPIGSLALYLAGAYFAALILGLLNTLAFPTPPSGYIAIGVMTLLGFVFFFLPLMRLHRRMLLQKKVERSKIAEKMAGVFRVDSEGNEQTEMARMFKLDIMERKISSIAGWPFDIQILGRLLVIGLSVTTVLLARVIAFYLKIVVPLG